MNIEQFSFKMEDIKPYLMVHPNLAASTELLSEGALRLKITNLDDNDSIVKTFKKGEYEIVNDIAAKIYTSPKYTTVSLEYYYKNGSSFSKKYSETIKLKTGDKKSDGDFLTDIVDFIFKEHSVGVKGGYFFYVTKVAVH